MEDVEAEDDDEVEDDVEALKARFQALIGQETDAASSCTQSDFASPERPDSSALELGQFQDDLIEQEDEQDADSRGEDNEVAGDPSSSQPRSEGSSPEETSLVAVQDDSWCLEVNQRLAQLAGGSLDVVLASAAGSLEDVDLNERVQRLVSSSATFALADRAGGGSGSPEHEPFDDRKELEMRLQKLKEGLENGFSFSTVAICDEGQPPEPPPMPSLESVDEAEEHPECEGATYCQHCDMWLNSPTQWADHKIGKKHRKQFFGSQLEAFAPNEITLAKARSLALAFEATCCSKALQHTSALPSRVCARSSVSHFTQAAGEALAGDEVCSGRRGRLPSNGWPSQTWAVV
ncbi:unnamed protein product [Polarella glacialis]|uniref:Zinc finger double-stranded RNA binding domain-containing protein n=1 Tax=Polarella glacialis TaxID=89957 RepID=A0A813HJJ1_POLGL|nr:unnamed protein product [Polarella glacialis]